MCKFNVKNSSFEMLVVFSPIFVADTKITFVYNFVAPLRQLIHISLTFFNLRNSLGSDTEGLFLLELSLLYL